MMRNAKTMIMLLLCASLLLAPMVVQAAEDGNTAAEVQDDSSPEGTGLLMLLMGVGGVFVVGLASISRNNVNSEAAGS